MDDQNTGFSNDQSDDRDREFGGYTTYINPAHGSSTTNAATIANLKNLERELHSLSNRVIHLERERPSRFISAAAVDEKQDAKRMYQISLQSPESSLPVNDVGTLVNSAFFQQSQDSSFDSSLKTTFDNVGATSAEIVHSDVVFPKRPLWISLRDFMAGMTKLVTMRNVMSGGTRYEREMKKNGEFTAWEAVSVQQRYPPITWILFLWPVVVPFWILSFGTLTMLQFVSWHLLRKAIDIPTFSIGLEDTLYTSNISDSDREGFKDFTNVLKDNLKIICSEKEREKSEKEKEKSEKEKGQSGKDKDQTEKRADLKQLKIPKIERYRPKPDSKRNSPLILLPETLSSYGDLSKDQKEGFEMMIKNISEIYLKCSQIHFRKIKDRWAVIGSIKQANTPSTTSGPVSKYQLLAHANAIDEKLTDIYETVNAKKSEISHCGSSADSDKDLPYELDLGGILCSIIVDSIPVASTVDGKPAKKYSKNIYRRPPTRQTVNTTSFPNTDIEEFLSYTVPAFLEPISMAFTAANTLINSFVAKNIFRVNASVLIAFSAVGMYSSIFMKIGSTAVNHYIFGGSFTYMRYAPISHRNVRWTGWFYFDTYFSFLSRQYSLLASFIEKSENGYILSDGTGLFCDKDTAVVGSNPLRTVKTAFISNAVLEKISFQLSDTQYLLPTEPNTIVTRKVPGASNVPKPITTLLIKVLRLARDLFIIMFGWLFPVFEPVEKFTSRPVRDDENREGIVYVEECRRAWEDRWHFCCPNFLYKCKRCNVLNTKSFTIIHRSELNHHRSRTMDSHQSRSEINRRHGSKRFSRVPSRKKSEGKQAFGGSSNNSSSQSEADIDTLERGDLMLESATNSSGASTSAAAKSSQAAQEKIEMFTEKTIYSNFL